jgi:hypothetical protein
VEEIIVAGQLTGQERVERASVEQSGVATSRIALRAADVLGFEHRRQKIEGKAHGVAELVGFEQCLQLEQIDLIVAGP